jgi:hypothetical protein
MLSGLDPLPELAGAWDGYVARSQAHPLLLEVLGPHYRRAVEG